MCTCCFFSLLLTHAVLELTCTMLVFQMVWLPSGRFSSRSSVMKTSSSGWPAKSTKRSRTHPSFCPKPTRSTRSSLIVRHPERCVCPRSCTLHIGGQGFPAHLKGSLFTFIHTQETISVSGTNSIDNINSLTRKTSMRQSRLIVVQLGVRDTMLVSFLIDTMREALD